MNFLFLLEVRFQSLSIEHRLGLSESEVQFLVRIPQEFLLDELGGQIVRLAGVEDVLGEVPGGEVDPAVLDVFDRGEQLSVALQSIFSEQFVIFVVELREVLELPSLPQSLLLESNQVDILVVAHPQLVNLPVSAPPRKGTC